MSTHTHLEKKLNSLFGIFNKTPPALALDFDGVISKLKSDPQSASVDKYCLELITKLIGVLPNISIISGRRACDLKSKINLADLTYIGNHGAEYIKDGKLIQEHYSQDTLAIVNCALNYIKSTTSQITGLFYEDKILSASIHFRGSNNHESTKSILLKALEDVPNADKLDIFWGKQILEIRPYSKFNKGYAINQLVKTKNITNLIFIGDDTTDIDAMIEIEKMTEIHTIQGFSIAVISDDSNKKLMLHSECSIHTMEEVREVLNILYDYYKIS